MSETFNRDKAEAEFYTPDPDSFVQIGDRFREVKWLPVIRKFIDMRQTVYDFEHDEDGDGWVSDHRYYELQRPVDNQPEPEFSVGEGYYRPDPDSLIVDGDQFRYINSCTDSFTSCPLEGKTVHQFEYSDVMNIPVGSRQWIVRRPRPIVIVDGERTSAAAWITQASYSDLFVDEKCVTKEGEPIKQIWEDEQHPEGILQEAARITSGDRQNQYGPPDQDFRRTADMVNAMWSDRFKEGMKLEPHHIAQLMVCMKLSRLQHQRKRDSVVDGAGYFHCMDKCYEANGGYPVASKEA